MRYPCSKIMSVFHIILMIFLCQYFNFFSIIYFREVIYLYRYYLKLYFLLIYPLVCYCNSTSRTCLSSELWVIHTTMISPTSFCKAEGRKQLVVSILYRSTNFIYYQLFINFKYKPSELSFDRYRNHCLGGNKYT